MNAQSALRHAFLITGTSSGIGYACAERLATDGFTVFAGVRSQLDAAKLGALHAGIRPVLLDVTDQSAIAAAASAIATSGCELRGVVNNAGIAVAGALEYIPLDELRKQFEVNVFGPLAVTQALLPMLRANRGRVVFVGSVSSYVTVPFIAPYSGSKFALRALTDALRLELEPTGVRVSLVAPGSARTKIWEKGRAAHAAMLAQLPADAPPHYRKSIDGVAEGIDYEERTGLPLEPIVSAIRHALFDRRPRAHYYVGFSAKGGRLLAALPGGLHDRIMRRSVRR